MSSQTLTDSPKNNVSNILKNLLQNNKKEVDEWFATASKNTSPFFYNSVDLRHSGFKLAPVDTNLFPAGFNNLNDYEREQAVKSTREFFKTYYPNVKNILLITEDHTRNVYYLENIYVLRQIIENAGFNLQISNFATLETDEETTAISQSGKEVTFKPFLRKDDTIEMKDGFTPDFILINNDLTVGAPDILKDIEQEISPPVGFGWYQRRKTSHFDAYNNLANDFCRKFDIDPWLITTYFRKCGVVNFKEKKGLECVAKRVGEVIAKIQKKYDEYGIKETPYVFIKSDRGTYGMGIMTAQSSTEVLEMGKKIRKKMNTIKGGTLNTEVIIQEGVPTIDKVEDHPAEPMMYMIGSNPVGCMYRLNTKKDSYGNLNASGMQFASIKNHNSDKNICEILGLVSKLASHAAAWECYVESYSI